MESCMDMTGAMIEGKVEDASLASSVTSSQAWMSVGDVMSKHVATAAKLMNISKISSIVVMNDDDVVGVLTQRDILKKVIARKKDPKGINVDEVMSSPVISVPPSYSVFSASKTMEDLNIRRLVIMNGKTVCGIITQTDIFRAVEDKLQAEEEKQQSLLKQSPSCIFSTDLQGVISYVNPAFARLFEVADPQELINQPFLAERFWRDPQERAVFLKDHQNWRFESQELSLKTAQGQELFVTVFSNFTTGPHGEINGREGIVCDITARRKAEAALKESHRELVEASHRAGSAEASSKILQRVECAFDSILALATHINDMLLQPDIQNPNTNARERHAPGRELSSAGNAEGDILLDAQARTADIRRELQTLVEEVNHIKNIIELPQG